MSNNEKPVVIDSHMSKEEILAVNPKNPAPKEIIDSIEIINVNYFGFDEKIHRGQIAMNKNVIEDVKKFFELALKLKFPIEKVIPISNKKYSWDDISSCEDNNSSGFNYRLVAGSVNKLSKHSTGNAFDINPVQNIYVRYENMKEVFRAPKNGIYNINTKGTLTSDNPLVILMKDLGWTWGGDWTPETGREDYQHFEKM